MRERIEDEIEELIAPYFDAAKGAVLHGFYEGELVLTDTPDLGARMAAVDKLLDRVYGRPKQVQEHTGEGGGAIQREHDLADPKVREKLRDAARAIDRSRSA